MLHLHSSYSANAILDALPEDTLHAIAPHLELVRIKAGMLDRVGEPMRHLHFPTTAMMSVQHLMEDGAMVEVAVVGREGAVGLATLVGGVAVSSRVEVRAAGMAYRVPTCVMRAEFERSAATYRLMLNYSQATMAQISRSALCNRHHSVSEQLSRWLLLAHDRIDGDELAVTQQTIANMLGVRREGVTEAAGDLQEAGLIRQRRGRITVLDRHGLEHHACECYDLIRADYRRLLGTRTNATPAPLRPRMPELQSRYPAHGA
ncbi:Crp/Fnr family transcriptional regulator [Burkholderia vietnamiensis]|uniref:Crp/Fnr family transcriptional regulator n=1 Tax=Burkholderia vietnamiensis TaxID=60552 RepID=UPI00075D2DA9|nr:Crp/Fnr family transcriptional regulator [Burkholderia vietnamiensis]AOJ15715.1 Crp/Fnr family transcriptional regulator [Burkholderia vietnamiensis]KVE52137.1 Crp/Fnr family transcriptional regulator [Burkholderia vietnamiensis]KVE65712.1 Crp/Fnr family transcriptional regulator [Burkholderia vietnamiensis]KVE70155.1 Crp/Fnr family transcriptional regulator [Burkholderia vietnamiensis]KVE88665.1 Crp/Fnr family transcriptional regulator [Burkholderia vietnamiensis]